MSATCVNYISKLQSEHAHEEEAFSQLSVCTTWIEVTDIDTVTRPLKEAFIASKIVILD